MHVVRTAFVVAAMAGATSLARAQVLDHLQCFKVKDPAAKAKYTADLLPWLGVSPSNGCSIKAPAKLLCVDTRKVNVSPTPPGAPTGQPGQPYLCYKLKCSAPQPPVLTAKDQFGVRALQVKGSSILCAPVSQLTVGTTSTTTTTTTTIPTCVDPFGPVAADVVAGFAFSIGPSSAFDVPASCGGSPAVCCPGGNPVSQCGPVQIAFVTASATLTPTADPDVFTFLIPTTLKTVNDIPIQVPLVGDCGLAIDTTQGGSTTVDITGQVGFSADRLRMGLQSVALSGLENADVGLTGDFRCTIVTLGLSFFLGTLDQALQSVASFHDLCRPCGSIGVAQCGP